MEFSETLKFEILKKLSYKSKRPPSEKTCKTKLGFAAAIVSSIASDPTPETVRLAVEIIKQVQIYLKDAYFPSLDKFILKILNKRYSSDLMRLLRHVEDPEIVAGICYIKFKYLSVVDERIFEVYHKLSGDIRYKVEKLLGKDILLKNTRTLNVENSIGGDKSIQNENNLDVGSMNDSTRSTFYSIQSGTPPIESTGVLSSIFARILSGKILNGNFVVVWNDFGGYSRLEDVSKKIAGNLRLAISMVNVGRLRDARAELLSLVESSSVQGKLIIYNHLAYIHFLFLEFHESIFYLDYF